MNIVFSNQMSQANASARARRAFISPTSQEAPTRSNSLNQPGGGVNSAGLTLPQVISIIDNRLVKLESFMKESNERTITNVSTMVTSDSTITNDVVEEFNHRFNILVDEIGTLKDIVMKLQSYTMDVNKTLYEERVNVFSDLGESPNGLVGGDNMRNEENVTISANEEEEEEGPDNYTD